MLVPHGKPLLGDFRARAGLTLAACAIVTVGLGLLFVGQTVPDGLDNAVDSRAIAFFAGQETLLHWLAAPATLIPAIAVSVATAAGCLIAGRLSGAVLAVTAVPVATTLNDALLKHVFHRAYLGALSFPSGHTASAAALTATLAVLLLVPPQRAATRSARVAVVATACVVTAVVAMAVIGLSWHYFTDTVAGAAVGLGTVCALALLLDLIQGALTASRALPPEPASRPEEGIDDGRVKR